MKKIRVGIIGHTGRLGLPLMQILLNHPFANIVYTESRSEGKHGNLAKAEVVFLALPYGKSKKNLTRLGNRKVIDLSIDHRNVFGWTYGLPEIFGAEISKATRVANPGCYATSVLLGLLPLKGKIKQVSISSMSGISGAGMEVAKEDNFLVYKEGRKHPQIGEMERVLKVNNILFVPQRIDTADRGIISTIFVQASGGLKNLSKLYAEAYKKCHFVRIIGSETEIETRRVIGSNYCDIKILEFGKSIVIISALDNLIKGGAGQAVQNFNLMCGFPETTGLT